MKALFLDIDGPLNTGRNDFLDLDRYGHHFDDAAVRNLRRIVEEVEHRADEGLEVIRFRFDDPRAAAVDHVHHKRHLAVHAGQGRRAPALEADLYGIAVFAG